MRTALTDVNLKTITNQHNMCSISSLTAKLLLCTLTILFSMGETERLLKFIFKVADSTDKLKCLLTANQTAEILKQAHFQYTIKIGKSINGTKYCFPEIIWNLLLLFSRQ